MRFELMTSVFALALAGIAPSAHAAPLYQESFRGASGSSTVASTFGWHLYNGTTATDDSGVATFYTACDVKAPPTSTTVATSTNTTDPTASTNSFGFSANGVNANTLLYGTPAAAVTIDGSAASPQTITFDQYNRNNTQSFVRAAAEVGGVFYVTNVTYKATGNQAAGTGGFGDPTSAVTQTVNLNAAKWQALTFAAGAALSFTSSTTTNPLVSLPSGTLQAIGVYYDASGLNGDVRLDNIAVNTPEPATLGMMVVAGAMVGRRRIGRR